MKILFKYCSHLGYLKVKLQFFSPFFFSIEEVIATLVITTIINISKILNDSNKIFTFSKMGDSILKIYVKGKFFFNSKYFELDPSYRRAHLVKHPVHAYRAGRSLSARMRSFAVDFVERLLGDVRKGHFDEDEGLSEPGDGGFIGLRQTNDPKGDVLIPDPGLRRQPVLLVGAGGLPPGRHVRHDGVEPLVRVFHDLRQRIPHEDEEVLQQNGQEKVPARGYHGEESLRRVRPGLPRN